MNMKNQRALHNDYYNSLYATLNITDGKIFCDENSLPWESPKFQYPEYKPSVNLKPFSELKYIVCDIETEGLYHGIHAIKSVGFRGNALANNALESESIKLIDNNEKDLLISVVQILRELDFKLLVFHNGFAFDIPFINNRCRLHGIEMPFILGHRAKITSASINGKPIEYIDYKFPGVYILDTLHLTAIWDRTFSKLSSYSLKVAPSEIGLRGSRNRVELTYQEILKCYENTDSYYNWSLILDYLEDDLKDTELLYKFLAPSIYYQLLLVPDMDLQVMARSSPAFKAEKIYEGLYKDCDTPNPDPTIQYEGALSRALGIGAFKRCFKIDVSSLYPSIMLNWGLCSYKDQYLKFLGFLKYTTDERLRLKGELKTIKKNTIEYNELDGRQNAFKVLINGCGYGFLGTSFYPYNSYSVAALITAYGRKILKQMMSVLDSYGFFVIVNIDTDGIVVSINENYNFTNRYSEQHLLDNVIESIHNSLPKNIRVDLEFSNANVYSPKAKNYVIFYNKDDYTCKGIFKKRNIPKFVAHFYLEYLRFYFYCSKKKADLFYVRYRKQLLEGLLLMSDFVTTRTISKAEKKIPGLGIANPGDKITYYMRSVPRYHKRSGSYMYDEEVPCRIDNMNDVDKILSSSISDVNSSKILPNVFVDYYVNELQKHYADVQTTLHNEELQSL